jgi:ATP-dependent Clp protease protease subunit
MSDSGWYHVGCDGRGEVAVYLFGQFPGPKHAESFFQELRKVPAPRSITVYINSMGGCVFTGMAIANYLRGLQCCKGARVVCEVDGVCGSAATLVAAAADETRMRGEGFLFLHRAAYVDGRAEDDQLAMVNDSMARRLSQRSGRSKDEVFELLNGERWLTAAEATSLGFADAIFEEV